MIRLSILKKKRGFTIVNNKININILKSFLKINIIKFVKIDSKRIFVYINYINDKPIYNNIINMFKASNKKFINLNTIKKINKKHNWILIISTSKGILNSFEAINLKVGGIMLAKIWN